LCKKILITIHFKLLIELIFTNQSFTKHTSQGADTITIYKIALILVASHVEFSMRNKFGFWGPLANEEKVNCVVFLVTLNKGFLFYFFRTDLF